MQSKQEVKQEAKKAVQSIWKLGGLTPMELARRVGREFNDDDVLGRAAQLSYYFLLALFPLMLFLMNVLGMLAGPGSQIRESMMAYLSQVMPGSAFDLVRNTLNEVHQSSSGIKLIGGLVAALWSASVGLAAITDTLNIAYEVEETRPFWKKRGVAVVLTLVLSVLVLSALTLILYGGEIAEWVGGKVGLGAAFVWAWKILQWPIALLFMAVSFAMIYYYAPNLKSPRWYWITPGTMVGLGLWILASLALRVYLQFFNSYSATYGSLGAVIILMLWFYISGIAILIGGEINSEIARAQESRDEHDSRLRTLEQRSEAA